MGFPGEDYVKLRRLVEEFLTLWFLEPDDLSAISKSIDDLREAIGMPDPHEVIPDVSDEQYESEGGY